MCKSKYLAHCLYAYWCSWMNSSLSLHSCVTWHLPIIHKVKWSLTLQNLYCIWWYMNIEQTCTAHCAVFCNKVKKVHQCNTLVPAREMSSDFHWKKHQIIDCGILELSNVCVNVTVIMCHLNTRQGELRTFFVRSLLCYGVCR